MKSNNTFIEDSYFQSAKSEFFGQSETEQTKLVYSYFGLTIYQAQCVEKTFENMLIAEKIVNSEKISQEIIESIFEKVENSKATMGTLIKNIKETYSISDKHERELKYVLEKRNHFSHKFFKLSCFKFFTEEGKLEMIKEFTDFISKSDSLDVELNDYYLEYKKQTGVTEKIIQQKIETARKKEYERMRNKKL